MDATTQPAYRYCSQCGRPTLPEELATFGDQLVCPNCKDIFVQKLREGVGPAAPAFHYGGFWIRFVAALLDGIILGVAGSILGFLIFGSMMPGLRNMRQDMPPEEVMSALAPMLGLMGLSMLVNMVIGCAYETIFVSRFGATPGKMALGLKVVRPNGGPVSTGRAAGRYFGKMLSSMILAIGYIMAGFDSQKRALHDMICDTRVIKTQG